MNSHADDDAPETWDAGVCEGLINEAWALSRSMISQAAQLDCGSRDIDPAHTASAVNLAH